MSKGIKISKTSRGFENGVFIDRSGVKCVIRQSSLATEDAIWLGTTNDTMHLTKEMVAGLLPLLNEFVKTGNLK